MKRFVSTLVSWGPLGLFFIALLDSAGIPMVGGVDALLLLLSSVDPGSAFGLAVIAVAGSAAGSLALYWIARRGGQAYLDRRTSGGRGRQLREWYRRYGLLTVFVPAVCPVPPLPMKVFILCAGAIGVSQFAFLAVLISARLIRYLGLAYLGMQLGRENSAAYLKSHGWLIFGVVVLLSVSIALLMRVVQRMRPSAPPAGQA